MPFSDCFKKCFWEFFSNFMHGFKNAILAIFQFCQNGTFDPVHDIRNFFLPKTFFWSIMKVKLSKNFPKMSKGPLNPLLRSAKVQKEDFLRKPSQDLEKHFCFGFVWIPQTPGKGKLEVACFLPSKSMYKQCGPRHKDFSQKS